MEKPEDIPQDVWDAAEAVAEDIPSGEGYAVTVSVGDIARAILAERKAQRERDAAYIDEQAAEAERSGLAISGEDEPDAELLLHAQLLKLAATAIRNGGE